MNHLSKERNRIIKEARHAHLYLFLDLDGTLAPIRRDPKKVKLGKLMRDVLGKLADKKDISVAVVSGRDLDSLHRIIGLNNVIYIGNHGFEASGDRMEYTLPAAVKAREIIREIGEKLGERLRKFKGVIVEDKTLTLSVHYRMADAKDMELISQEFENITGEYRKKRKIRVTKGKKVWEIRPPVSWNKGKAVKKILRQEKQRLKNKIVPIFMGDDVTDEDMFKLFRTGYTVKITKKADRESAANYYLRNIGEVRSFLRNILT